MDVVPFNPNYGYDSICSIFYDMILYVLVRKYHQFIIRDDTSRDPCNTAYLFSTHFPRRVMTIVEDTKIEITLHFHL